MSAVFGFFSGLIVAFVVEASSLFENVVLYNVVLWGAIVLAVWVSAKSGIKQGRPVFTIPWFFFFIAGLGCGSETAIAFLPISSGSTPLSSMGGMILLPLLTIISTASYIAGAKIGLSRKKQVGPNNVH